MKKWQKSALGYGIASGTAIFALNVVLTFAPLTPSWNALLSYAVVPLIMLSAALSGYRAARETGKTRFAALGGILAAGVSVVIGFTTLFILTFLFMDTVSRAPATILEFQSSGGRDIRGFIVDRTIRAALSSVPVSLVIGVLFGAVGGLLRGKTERS